MKKERYTIIKQTLPKEVATLCYEYMLFKRDVTSYLVKDKYFPPFDETFGTFSDVQIDNAFCTYGDVLMDLLLQKVKPIVEEFTKLQLIETYSYARVYQTGNELERHVDRESCEVSATLNLGGDPWPIYLSPDENVGIAETNGGVKGITTSSNAKGLKVDLEPGDMLVYRGCILEHWRESFQGNNCAQVFLHYNIKNKNSEKIKYDKREFIGVPYT